VDVLITGITGQDGSYLAELLLAAGQRVAGLIHPHDPVPAYFRPLIGHAAIRLEHCDLSDPTELRHALRALQPQRVFHLAALSFPPDCEQAPEESRKVNVTSVEVLCEWLHRDQPSARALVCSSAAVFGSALGPQSEAAANQPGSEYGRQKLAVRQVAQFWRDKGLFLACAIPFNHESERRPESFVFAKVCAGAARIALGRASQLNLGNLSPVRDWGFAPEYAQAYAWMLDIDHPAELVLATGEGHSVRELVAGAFAEAGLNWREHVQSDPALIRAHDPSVSVGNPARALEELNWEAGTKFHALIKRLVQAHLARLKREAP
jgi:GDPmannose 4,6-dehydratase